jgi:6-pyruvoyltetrahydropterin/6-carboxytetrahydropterin synthase
MSDFKGFFRIHIRKEALKFSSAHMTFFADGTKENLHGHNYRTVATLEFDAFSLSTMLPFHDLKSEMRKITKEWDEKILLPSKCPFLKTIETEGPSLEIEASGKKYVFPKDEVVFLDTDNVTTESLAKLFCERFVKSLSKPALERAKVRTVEIKIEEILGQGASYVITL